MKKLLILMILFPLVCFGQTRPHWLQIQDRPGYVNPSAYHDGGSCWADALEAAAATGKVLHWTGTLSVERTVNLRYARVDAPHGTIRGHTEDIVLLTGGNSASGNNPEQRWGTITRHADFSSVEPIVRIVGAKGQHIYIQSCPFVQLYADTDSATTSSIAYSSFFFKRVDRIDLDTNPSPSGSTVQWINENYFYLNRTDRIDVSGTYHHNHNNFYMGGDSLAINLHKGRDNTFHNIRGEGTHNYYCAAGTNGNQFILGTYISTGISFTNEGSFTNRRIFKQEWYPIFGFDYQSLGNTTVEANSLRHISNISTLVATDTATGTFSVNPWSFFFESPFLPAVKGDGVDTYLYSASVGGRSSGGIRLEVKGYDADGNEIPSDGNQVFFRGSGSVSFGDYSSGSNTESGHQFNILDGEAAFIKVRARAGADGLVARSFQLLSSNANYQLPFGVGLKEE